jgi:hypothetical protein
MRELSQFHADTKPYDWQSTIIKMIKKTSSHGGRRDFWVIVRLRSYHCLQCEGEVDVGQLHMKPLIKGYYPLVHIHTISHF